MQIPSGTLYVCYYMCSHNIQNIQLKTKQYFILDNIGTKIIKNLVYEWYTFNRITSQLYLLFV